MNGGYESDWETIEQCEVLFSSITRRHLITAERSHWLDHLRIPIPVKLWLKAPAS